MFQKETRQEVCTNDNHCDGFEQYGHSDAAIFSSALDMYSNHSKIFPIPPECGRGFFSYLSSLFIVCVDKRHSLIKSMAGCFDINDDSFASIRFPSNRFMTYTHHTTGHIYLFYFENSNTRQNKWITKNEGIAHSQLQTYTRSQLQNRFYGVQHTHIEFRFIHISRYLVYTSSQRARPQLTHNPFERSVRVARAELTSI